MDSGPQLRGKRALVTGGTKGIGDAVASRLRDLGATVLVTARTIPNDLEAVSLFVAADVATVAGCTVVANAVMKQLRGIDIIVHVVGGLRLPPAASPY